MFIRFNICYLIKLAVNDINPKREKQTVYEH